jgi:8-oxo-dGTP diphosphatase
MLEAKKPSNSDLKDLYVVAAIIFKDGKIMAAKRLAGGPSGLMWEFPGGKVEQGERPEEALIREIREELGMIINVREELGSYVTELGIWRLRLHCFICHATTEPSKLEAHSEIGWFAIENLEGLEWALPDVPAVEALRGRS